MNSIEKMLAGEMEISAFVAAVRTDPSLQDALNALIPEEAKENRTHDFWRFISYDTVKRNDYNVVSLLNDLCRFDGTLGDDLNIWGTIQTVYLYHHPGIPCTKQYEDAYNLYLDVVKDCFDGPEVNFMIQRIIREALKLKTKKQQREQAKNEILRLFHAIENKRPRWIHGPDWPMGSRSPMKFISRSRNGEVVQFLFEDADTGEKRIVEQFY